MRHFLTLNDFSKDEILAVTNLALKLKQESSNGTHTPYLKGKILAMIFEKSSTRTRVSFEGGIYQLGGHGMFLSHKDIQLGRGEPIKDTSRVISSMVDMVMMRTDKHEKLQEFAEYSSVPIINGLSDDFHPVQLMADYLTMLECGIALPDEIHKNGLKKPIVAYIGDGNNMAHSWINLAAILGFELRVASPLGYFPRADIVESALKTCKQSGGAIHIMQEPQKAVSGVNVVVTDTWASMGQEEQKKEREKAFVGFCVDDSLMSLTQEDSIFLHCLPAYRGQEVSESVLEGKQSRVFQEANNRLHAQKAVMLALMKLNNLSLAYPLEMEL